MLNNYKNIVMGWVLTTPPLPPASIVVNNIIYGCLENK
jgi:hypothetical protein